MSDSTHALDDLAEPTHRHWKGGLYRKLHEAKYEPNAVHMVVYQSISTGEVWVRDASVFNGDVVLPALGVNDGSIVRRFEPLKAQDRPLERPAIEDTAAVDHRHDFKPDSGIEGFCDTCEDPIDGDGCSCKCGAEVCAECAGKTIGEVWQAASHPEPPVPEGDDRRSIAYAMLEASIEAAVLWTERTAEQAEDPIDEWMHHFVSVEAILRATPPAADGNPKE